MNVHQLISHRAARVFSGARTPCPASVLPGVLLTAAIAGAAFALRSLPGLSMLSPMILAMATGMFIRNVFGAPARARRGVLLSMRTILRLAIMLLGLQLTFAQVATVGAVGVALIAATLAASFFFTTWLGRTLGVERGLCELIAAGTSICGASAVVATNAVTGAKDEDVAYAIACVTLFGSIAMFSYPPLGALLHLSPNAYGLWAGASIHEVAQVVAASFQLGREAGEFGALAKLSRVMMLAPVVMALGALRARSSAAQDGARPPAPWFVYGFIAMVGLNSLLSLAPETKATIASGTTFLLAMALAAMGLETDLAKLRVKGVKPFILGLASFLFIACFSLLLVKATT
jgi:uncharacterized integral membrane protein (TIGR00698 family)